jgi:hypothetical protein
MPEVRTAVAQAGLTWLLKPKMRGSHCAVPLVSENERSGALASLTDPARSARAQEAVFRSEIRLPYLTRAPIEISTYDVMLHHDLFGISQAERRRAAKGGLTGEFVPIPHLIFLIINKTILVTVLTMLKWC